MLIISVSECNCNPDGSITLECDSNGDCTCKGGFTGSKCDECKPNVIGDTCDECRPNYYNYPLCQGMSKQLVDEKSILTSFFRV